MYVLLHTQEESMYALKTYDITKKYGSVYAADKVNLSVKKGAVLGIIGENGAGKSTTLKMITQTIFPTSGKVEFFEGSTVNKKPRIGGYVDFPKFYGMLSAAENIEVIRRIAGVDSCLGTDEILETVGLSNAKKKRVSKFSLGMKQRLALAIALVTKPDIVILDEPLNGLDPIGIQDFRELISSMVKSQDITFIISSHLLLELEKIATDYVIMQKGKVIAEFSAEKLSTELKNFICFKTDQVETVKNILKADVAEKDMKVEEKQITVLTTMDKYATLISKVESYCSDISVDKQDLESYYKGLIGK